MSPSELVARITEHDPVRRWRLEQLQRAGYAPSDALVLSGRTSIDVHRAANLLRKGCPTETAVRILL